MRTPTGITPPSPGQHHEEPELRQEADIPSDDGGAPAAAERQPRESGSREERPLRKVERE